MQDCKFQPIYIQVKEAIIKNIHMGKFQYGTFLPPERDLQQEFKVSRITIRKAMEELNKDGLIEKSKGKRSRINKPEPSACKNMAFVTEVPSKTLPDIYRMFYESLLKKCNTANIRLYHLDISEKLPDFLSETSFDAIFISGRVQDKNAFTKLVKPETKLILLDDIFDDEQFITVCTDNQKGGEDAASFLINRGCKKLLFLGVESAYHYRPFRDRKAGFIKACNNAGAEYFITDIEKDSQNEIRRNLEELPFFKDVDGIFAFNDDLAANTIKALTKMGISIPDKVSIIGFDGLEFGEFIAPTLSTIEQPIGNITEKAFEIACNQESGKIKTFKIPGQIIKRESA
jgi:GntR family transcriptional regulator of arabinose operon